MNNFQKNLLISGVLLIISIVSLVILINHDNSDSLAASTQVSTSEENNEIEIINDPIQTIPVQKLMAPKEPNEQQVLFVGDSITWLDGNSASKDIGEIIGFQEVFRKKGYNVSSYGVSGSTLSYEKVEKAKSLYYDIFEDNKVDVSNKDIIVLFAGTNDIGFGCEFGDIYNKDSDTTLGALNQMLDYVNHTNPQAKVYVVSPIYSSHEDRPDEKLKDLTNKFRVVSNYHHARFINLYDDSKINKETAEKYLYDGLHPNNEGMQVIGEDMLKVIENDL